MGRYTYKMVKKQEQKGTKSKKPAHRYTIKCTDPVEDNVLVLSDFEQFLLARIKVDGKLNNLGSQVTVAKDKDALIVEAKMAFSKRYLKYLTKKYLKQQDLRAYLRVIATNKNQYELKFLHVNNDAAEDEQ